MRTLAFFNNKGGVGNTSLVYHLAWMYGELGLSVIAADLDPQANLTVMFLDELQLEQLWPEDRHPKTIFGALQPLLDGTGDIAPPHVEPISDRLGLLVGDLALSACEDELNSQWPDCLDRKPRAFRVLSAFWRVIEIAAKENAADLVLIDVGPNLGAINRAVLIAAHSVVIPLAPDRTAMTHTRKNSSKPPHPRYRTAALHPLVIGLEEGILAGISATNRSSPRSGRSGSFAQLEMSRPCMQALPIR